MVQIFCYDSSFLRKHNISIHSSLKRVSFVCKLRLLENIMKVSTILFYSLTIVLSIITNAVTATTDANDVPTDDVVPFYLKMDETNPNGIIAVVYYGELGDVTKEIEVKCTMNEQSSDKYVGPESITCHCVSIRKLRYGCSGFTHNSDPSQMLGTSKCELHVPFRFVRDANGEITSVVFEKDNIDGSEVEDNLNPVLVVPFYPNRDKDGNIVAVMVSNSSDTSSSSMLTPFTISLIAVVGSIVVFLLGRCVYRTVAARKTTARKVDMENAESVTPPKTTTTTSNSDDDTVTESSSSIADGTD
jgi:hypothetical protein